MLERWLTAEEILLDPEASRRNPCGPRWRPSRRRRRRRRRPTRSRRRRRDRLAQPSRPRRLARGWRLATSFTPSDARGRSSVCWRARRSSVLRARTGGSVSSMTAVVVLRNDLGVAGFDSARRVWPRGGRCCATHTVPRPGHPSSPMPCSTRLCMPWSTCSRCRSADRSRRCRRPTAAVALVGCRSRRIRSSRRAWCGRAREPLARRPGRRAVPDDVAVAMLTSRSAGFAGRPLSGRLRR